MQKTIQAFIVVTSLLSMLVACPKANTQNSEATTSNKQNAVNASGTKSPEKAAQTVVIYVSEDQVFSQPILKGFEKETGIQVKAIYDTEESKSTGVMNRLLAEKGNPQADVYWANEPIRAELLRQKGILAAYTSPQAAAIPKVFKNAEGYWTGFSARARVLVVNSAVKEPPKSIKAYSEAKWKSQTVIANPLFGTTTSQFAALFSLWGNTQASIFLRDIKQNNVAIATSNGESADFVASGQYKFSLVDSDDAIARMRQKKSLTMIYPDQEKDGLGVFIVPNTVMLIKGAQHPEAARKLIDYLLSAQTEGQLAFADCAQIPLHPGVKLPPELKPIEELKIMQVDYAEVAKRMLQIQPLLKEWMGM